MSSHILSLHKHSTPEVKPKHFTKSNDDMLHTKLKGMEHRAPFKHIFCPYTHPQSQMGSKSQKNENSMLHIKLKGMEHRAPSSTYSVLTHTFNPQMGSKSQNIFFIKVVMLHIKLKGMEHRATSKHIFCPYTHLRHWGKAKTFFSEINHVAYQIKGNRAPCKHIYSPNTHPRSLGLRQNVKNVLKSSHAAYQIKGNVA